MEVPFKYANCLADELAQNLYMTFLCGVHVSAFVITFHIFRSRIFINMAALGAQSRYFELFWPGTKLPLN